MNRLTRIIGFVATTTALWVGVAAAATLGVGTDQLSAGRAVVVGCTTAALTVTRNVDNQGVVTQVNVLGIPQACAGETLAVTLESNGGASLGGSTGTVGACSGGCTVTVTGFGTVPAASIGAYALSLTQ